MEEARKRRRLEDYKLYRKRLCQLNKWDYLKQLRIEHEREGDRIIEHIRRIRALARVVAQATVLRRFWKFYTDGKKKKIDELRTKFLVATIVFKFKIKCRKFGEQVGVRRKRDIRRTITAILPPVQRVTKERAATLLKRFLFVADLNRSVKSGVIDTVNTIKTLQQKLRKRKTILQGRQEVLKQLVFEHYKTLCEHFIKKKDSKSTDLLKKLN